MLVAALIVLNVLIGVVLNSMEEARELELEREREALEKLRAEGGDAAAIQGTPLEERVVALRLALEELERELAAVATGGGRGHAPHRRRPPPGGIG